MSDFNNFLISNIANPSKIDLNVVHTANGEDFCGILSSKLIRASSCQVFNGEKLCYFFVGRPAYKTRTVENPAFWQLPAVFILKSPRSINPKRVFPFDSGALSDERYRDVIGKLGLAHFEVDSEWRSIDRLIDFFFGSAEDYRSGNAKSYQEVRKIVGDNVSNFAVLATAKLYNHQFNSKIDDRSRLVEVQFDADIPLDDGLKKVVICKEWLRDQKIRRQIEDLNCEIAEFDLYPLSSYCYYSKIYELAS